MSTNIPFKIITRVTPRLVMLLTTAFDFYKNLQSDWVFDKNSCFEQSTHSLLLNSVVTANKLIFLKLF